ncbi:chemotaxis protein CheD [Methanosalsum natronophilum]|uniref:Probable chemoreceptor glutamine deamidase CheD n=1 Tax=Methanosalsum natronophilum TaxID=768733 RepID=A0A3R7VSH7_9EURY|nr:chemotaxis protein CheD [Methanosalsum natronophilum]MCS3922975.1 chemotaxis protein CheD [Methanosalsum natronophilum]RQD83077.1 MAG: chemotaxis protein CheD [Methanosalsum natronophilum]
MNIITVGMADYAIGTSPISLTTLGLGSCVGITLYDSKTKLGGLLHIMLPSVDQARSKENLAKFADTGIPLLIDDIIERGASKRRLEAKIVGGASMFSSKNGNLKIGERNISSTKEVLYKLNIPIKGQDTGKNYGRTIKLDTNTGNLTVKSALYGTIII